MGREESREGLLNMFGLSFGDDENVLELEVIFVQHHEYVLNATEVFTLKWLILCDFHQKSAKILLVFKVTLWSSLCYYIILIN